MSDTSSDYDPARPSQAEGEDPERPDDTIVLQPDGKPSPAEGDDPASGEEQHEVLNPVDPE
ncbi:hypothetical protein [Amnibacterium endophyticum]|uniref:Multidrug transporter n=1 Tax=Amnibacterium endophyticum TaxID=2109337 RepID=A0ABW4LBR9_9MICO